MSWVLGAVECPSFVRLCVALLFRRSWFRRSSFRRSLFRSFLGHFVTSLASFVRTFSAALLHAFVTSFVCCFVRSSLHSFVANAVPFFVRLLLFPRVRCNYVVATSQLPDSPFAGTFPQSLHPLTPSTSCASHADTAAIVAAAVVVDGAVVWFVLLLLTMAVSVDVDCCTERLTR